MARQWSPLTQHTCGSSGVGSEAGSRSVCVHGKDAASKIGGVTIGLEEKCGPPLAVASNSELSFCSEILEELMMYVHNG